MSLLLTTISGPFEVTSTDLITARIVSLRRYLSESICFLNEIFEEKSSYCEILNKAKKPFLIVGNSAINGEDGEDVLDLCAQIAKKFNIDFSILDAVNASNENRPQMIVKKILDTKKIDSNSSIALLGLSFKPNTDDIRDSTSLKIASILQGHNIKINCYDPAAMANAKPVSYTHLTLPTNREV